MKKIIMAMMLTTTVYVYADEMHKHEMGVDKDVRVVESVEKIHGLDYGNKMVCPVMKDKFFVTDKTPYVDYEGKRYYFCCKGCIDKFKKEPQKYISNTDLDVGNKFICPVTGNEFTPTSNSPKFEYNGKIYYFCCSHCIEKFSKEPQKYIKQAGTDKNKTVYTCKTCEVELDKPGKCPKCGMELKKKEKKCQHKHNGKMHKICDESKEGKTKTYSLEDVSKHNKKGDCWLVIENKVYDASDFSYKHNENILLGCGKDATKLFKTGTTDDGKKIKGWHPHPKKAYEILKKLYIGELSN